MIALSSYFFCCVSFSSFFGPGAFIRPHRGFVGLHRSFVGLRCSFVRLRCSLNFLPRPFLFVVYSLMVFSPDANGLRMEVSNAYLSVIDNECKFGRKGG
ncbi:hypothetical protein EVA_05689 [gut metagenome]|uniref:Uncharacterized protein n=1 Tax=gut metagenome TaxID=749906 RepID=J9GGU0_9ZZZZ